MIEFYLNGKHIQLDDSYAHLMLSDYLRFEKCLTGTKVVCAEGDCGACSILKYNPLAQGIDSDHFVSINSCIAPMTSLHGNHILTIEALEGEKLHQAQSCMMKCHASQCGFCTPGFAIALAGLCEEKLARKDYNISEVEGKNALTGNLCRCTGYNTIIDAAKSVDLKQEISLKSRYQSEEIEAALLKICETEIKINTEEFSFYAPINFEAAANYLNQNEDVRIVASATDLGVVHNKRKIRLNNILSLHLIKEAYQISETDGVIQVGARANLSELRHFLKNRCEEYKKYLDIFASPQIKNTATLVGNIANASPIGDNAPALLALDAEVEILSTSGVRVEKLSDFFLDYRKTTLKKNELIKSVRFKVPKDNELKLFKSSLRKDLDISTVNFGVLLAKKDKMVDKILIGAGGIAAIPLRLKATEDFLRGQELTSELIDKACVVGQKEFNPISDVRSSSAYRRVIFENHFKRVLGSFL